MTPEEKKKKESIDYTPVTGSVNPLPETPRDMVVTGVGVTEQGGNSRTDSSAYAKTTTGSESTTETSAERISGVNPDFVDTPKIDINKDSVLMSIGKQRQERLQSLQRSLQSSADREKRKLKFNAWTDLITSLGNIAGLGNATPVQTDNRRTLESFKRLQDIYDAADNIDNDPTLTWLDRERLNRQAVIAASNLQAEATDAALRNQFEMAMARETGIKRTTKTKNDGTSETSNRGSNYSRQYNKNVQQQGVTEDAGGEERINPKDIVIKLTGGGAFDAEDRVPIDQADVETMTAALNEARKDAKSRVRMGGRYYDASAILESLKGLKYTDVNGSEQVVGSALDLTGLMASLQGDTGDSKYLASQVAARIDAADTDKIFYRYFSGNLENPNFMTKVDFEGRKGDDLKFLSNYIDTAGSWVGLLEPEQKAELLGLLSVEQKEQFMEALKKK